VWGIFPIKWLKWLIFVIGLILYVVLTYRARRSYPWKLIVSSLIVGAFFLSKYLCFADFAAAMKPYLLTRPTHWTDLGAAIYPFDSASRGVRWARGRIGNAEFVKAQEEPELRTLSRSATATAPDTSVAPRYRIALLHHHPLPIPYDSSQEPLMVMEDAGAFLSEISNQQIPLVLHGHKHHHHFSRVTIGAGESRQFETSVLATGTATAGKRPGRFGFNFNLISIEADGNARVLPYVANGGTFRPEESFWAQEPEASARRTYAEAATQHGFSARTLMALMDLNSDGDSRQVY
jgi:3',5'-cyclic AMP phosphodiesterase CpdA